MSRKQSFCFLLSCLLVCTLLIVLLPTSVSKADEVVTFPDPNLEAAIREAIGKPTGDIYQSDLDGLTYLGASGRSITDLTGLEHCTSLAALDLHRNQVSDLSPLSGLTSLIWLYLPVNQISNLSPLSGLTSLTSLDLVWNQISDLSPLSGLTSVRDLNLSINQISDLSPLSGLTSLTSLSLMSNQITDLPPLSGLTSLTWLHLSGNLITNLSPLSGLTGLTWVNLAYNQIGDLSPLSGLTSLTELYLFGNQISDISPLSGLSSLTYLDLSVNQISDLSPLSGLTSLTGLGLYDNQISDLTPLSGLTSLEDLSLATNQISDISPLSGLTGLTWVNLAYNQIGDLSPLSGLTSLTMLRVDDNQIGDVSPLSSLTNLGDEGYEIDLDLSGNQVSNISPLVDNPGLANGDTVDLRDNPLSAISISTYIPQLEARGVAVLWDGVVPVPDIHTPIGAIDFGSVTVGSNLDKTTTIYNDGTATLTVNSISRTSGSSEFTYVGPSTPFTIGPGRSQTVTLRFAPGSTGSKSATFTVTSNDPDEASVGFSTSGSGQAAPVNISARIDSYSADPREVEVSAAVTLRFSFTNTGNTPWTFQAAATLRKPNGSWVNLALKPVYLGVGQQGSATWTYAIDTEGSWDLVFGIWQEPEQVNSLGQTGWLDDYVTVQGAGVFPGENASTLSEYYSAWGKSLPLLSERAKIYQALGLGSAGNYAGTAQQNTQLLDALKTRRICPLTVADIVAQLIEQQATGGIPVTVDGQYYIILTLQNRIDPTTLEVVTGSGATKVYVYGDRNEPVSALETVRRIGLVDYVLSHQPSSQLRTQLQQELDEIQNAKAIAAAIDLVEAAIDTIMIVPTISAVIKTLIPDAVTALASTVWNPMEELKELACSDLDIAYNEYSNALSLARAHDQITDYAVAHEFLDHLLWGDIRKELGITLLQEIYEKWDNAVAVIIETALRAVIPLSLVEIVGDVFDAEKAERLKDDREAKLEAASADIDFQLNRKLYEAAPYTLELANCARITLTGGSPVELRIYDSELRVTGMVSGVEKTEIPYSTCLENTITVFSPTDSYTYHVVGVGEGSYDVTVTRVTEEETLSIKVTGAPISLSGLHQYSVDWAFIAEGKNGVTVQIDADGDGIFEQDIIADAELTQEEWLSAITKGEALPVWVWIVIGLGAVAVLTGGILIGRRWAQMRMS
jgi:internalin A